MELVKNIFNLAIKYPQITLNSLAPIFVIFVALLRYKYLRFSLKVLLGYLFFVVITDIPVWIMAAKGINNLFYVNIIKSISEIILCVTYYFHIKNTKKRKHILICIFILFILSFFQIIFLNDIGEFAFTLKIPLIFVVFLHFQTVLNELEIKDLIYYPFFWISSGLMLICCFSIMILLFYNYTLHYNIKDKNQYWFYTSFLEFVSILFYIFMLVGFWVSNKKYK